MPLRTAFVFMREIEIQCEFALAAYSSTEASVGAEYSFNFREFDKMLFWRSEAFRSAQAYLTHAANVSKIFSSPRRKSNSDARHRGNTLSKLFGIDETYEFMSRNVRNDLEHFDERIDAWAAKDESLALDIADQNSMPFGLSDISVREGNVHQFRQMMVGPLRFRFADNEIDLEAISRELRNIGSFASQWSAIAAKSGLYIPRRRSEVSSHVFLHVSNCEDLDFRVSRAISDHLKRDAHDCHDTCQCSAEAIRWLHRNGWEPVDDGATVEDCAKVTLENGEYNEFMSITGPTREIAYLLAVESIASEDEMRSRRPSQLRVTGKHTWELI